MVCKLFIALSETLSKRSSTKVFASASSIFFGRYFLFLYVKQKVGAVTDTTVQRCEMKSIVKTYQLFMIPLRKKIDDIAMFGRTFYKVPMRFQSVWGLP